MKVKMALRVEKKRKETKGKKKGKGEKMKKDMWWGAKEEIGRLEERRGYDRIGEVRIG